MTLPVTVKVTVEVTIDGDAVQQAIATAVDLMSDVLATDTRTPGAHVDESVFDEGNAGINQVLIQGQETADEATARLRAEYVSRITWLPARVTP